MIKVTKEEAMAIRKYAPASHVTVVNRQSSHKKYFAEENRETDAILRDLRQRNVIYSAGVIDEPPVRHNPNKFQQKPKHDQNRHRGSFGSNGPRRERRDEFRKGGVR